MISFNQFNAEFMSPNFMESLLLKWIREFPEAERGKLLDLLHRFSTARRYTGEIKFDFQWLLTAETEYDPRVNPEQDVLSCFQHAIASEMRRQR